MNLYVFKIALRYLRAGRRDRFLRVITVIAALGVAFGAAALLIALAVIDGFESKLSESMVAFSGHIEIASVSQKPLDGYKNTLRQIRADKSVKGASPYVSREAILRSGSGLEGVRLKGVVPSQEVSAIGNMMVSGKFAFTGTASDTTALQIIIGARLADRLHVRPGDSLVLFVPDGVPSPSNPPVVQHAVLTGTYRTGMAEYDDVYAYTSLESAQLLFGMQPDQVSGYDIVLHQSKYADSLARMFEMNLGYPHYSRTMYDMFRSIFAWLDLQRRPIPIVLGLIIIVAVFNVLATLLMVVLEKTESIGVLATLGAKPRGIIGIFVAEGILISAVGTALGCGIALAFTLLQMKFKLLKLNADIYFVDSVPVVLVAWHYVLVIAVALVLSILATLVPAYVASRLQPVDALRFK